MRIINQTEIRNKNEIMVKIILADGDRPWGFRCHLWSRKFSQIGLVADWGWKVGGKSKTILSLEIITPNKLYLFVWLTTENRIKHRRKYIFVWLNRKNWNLSYFTIPIIIMCSLKQTKLLYHHYALAASSFATSSLTYHIQLNNNII